MSKETFIISVVIVCNNTMRLVRTGMNEWDYPQNRELCKGEILIDD